MTNILHLHTKAEQDFNTDLLSERDRLCAEYDRRVDCAQLLAEHWKKSAEAKQRVRLSNGSDALILIAGALLAALVGTVIGVVQQGWFQ